MSESLARLLAGSQYIRYLDCVPSGVQLPLFIGTVNGLKPAMDLWVLPENWPAFERMAQSFGLLYSVDTIFDRHDERLRSISPSMFATTRAGLSRDYAPLTEAHVFLSRDAVTLNKARASGWYPLIVNGRLIEKHPGDHQRFGEALGYPKCCRCFFESRNNWLSDNTLYAAFERTNNAPHMYSNSLMRSTAYGLVPHMACSFHCIETIQQASLLSDAIEAELPLYRAEIMRRCSGVFLTLSERRIYRFTEAKREGNRLAYAGVEPLGASSADDELVCLLHRGTSATVDGPFIFIERYGRLIGCYQTEGTQHGPECPYVIEFASMA